jgi:uncharacterized membrane protein YvlD (DUF360 family)
VLGKVTLTFEKALTPIFVFALLNAVVCWIAAWVFRETFEFKALLLALGCMPIVVAVCAYILVLVHKVERDS